MENEGNRYGVSQRGASKNLTEQQENEGASTPSTEEILYANRANSEDILSQQYFTQISLEGQPFIISNQLYEDQNAETSLLDMPVDTSINLQAPIRPNSTETVIHRAPAQDFAQIAHQGEARVLVSEPTQYQERSTKTLAANKPYQETDNNSPISPTEKLLLSMAETLNVTLKEIRCTSNQPLRWNLQNRTLPYQFSGLDHENPTWFLEKMNNFFYETKIDEELERLNIFGDQSLGAARTWFRANIQLVTTYDELITLFEQKYNSPEEIADVFARLYGEKQQPQEKVASFITRKRRMSERLIPSTPFTVIAGIIINQIEPELRSRLRTLQVQNFEELIRRATQIESDLEDLRKINARSRQQTNTVNTNSTPIPIFRRTPQIPNQIRGPAPQQVSGPSRPCTYCGTWHFHSQCSRNPYRPENSDRIGEQQARNQASVRDVNPGQSRNSTHAPSVNRNSSVTHPSTTPPFRPRTMNGEQRPRVRFRVPETTSRLTERREMRDDEE